VHRKLQVQVQELAEQLDGEYFKLKEPLEEREDAGKTDPEEMRAFAKARAISAVAAAMSASRILFPQAAKEAAASAAYEALFAVRDSESMMDAIEKALPA
jgi:hypothetical protein